MPTPDTTLEAIHLKDTTQEHLTLFIKNVAQFASRLGYNWEEMFLGLAHETEADFGEWKVYRAGVQLYPSYLFAEFQSQTTGGFSGTRKVTVYPTDTLGLILNRIGRELTWDPEKHPLWRLDRNGEVFLDGAFISPANAQSGALNP